MVDAEGACCPRSGQVSDEGCSGCFLTCTSPTQKPAFLDSHYCYSILAKSHTSLKWDIPAHTDPLLPVPLTCAGAYTLLPGQYKPAACSLPQTGTINIVPSLERLLKAKQLSGQHCKQPVLQADLHSLFIAACCAACSRVWRHATAWQPISSTSIIPA